MNLNNELTTNERILLKNIGIIVENREYSNEELRKYEIKVEEFIMSHSVKNGDVDKLINKYNSILKVFVNR